MGIREADQAALENDLKWVAMQRLRNVFNQVGDEDERRHPTLARVVKALKSESQWRNDYNKALREVIREAIRRLPLKMSGRYPTDLPDKTRHTQWAGSPEQEVAEIMYGYRNTEVDFRYQDGVEMPISYAKDYLPAAFRKAHVEHASERNKGRITEVIRQDLAAVLLDMEQKAIERQARGTRDIGAEFSGSEPSGPVLIDRSEYSDRIRAYLNAGQLLVCIWGEPGTGKTTLANQVARHLARDSTVTILRAGKDDVLEGDIIRALITEGMEPTDWNVSYMLAKFQLALNGAPNSSVVVLDNFDDWGLINQLIPEHPSIPILVTSRNEPHDPRAAKLELHNFTEAQACAFISHELPGQDEEEVIALARTLGHRPLALDLAVRFVGQATTTKIPDLLTRLGTSTTEALNTITPFDAVERNLHRLYEAIMMSVAEDGAALHLLDSFLAASGVGGVQSLDLIQQFMLSTFGGATNVVAFDSGLLALAARGLLREEASYDERLPSRLLVMHSLTYRILRELRGRGPRNTEMEYYKFIIDSDEIYQAFEDGSASDSLGIIQVGIIRNETIKMKQLNLPPTWWSLVVVDSATFVAIRKELHGIDFTTGNFTESQYLVRYERDPDQTFYVLDYRTGKRVKLDPGSLEAQEFRAVVILLRDNVRPYLNEMQRLPVEDED